MVIVTTWKRQPWWHFSLEISIQRPLLLPSLSDLLLDSQDRKHSLVTYVNAETIGTHTKVCALLACLKKDHYNQGTFSCRMFM